MPFSPSSIGKRLSCVGTRTELTEASQGLSATTIGQDQPDTDSLGRDPPPGARVLIEDAHDLQNQDVPFILPHQGREGRTSYQRAQSASGDTDTALENVGPPRCGTAKGQPVLGRRQERFSASMESSSVRTGNVPADVGKWTKATSTSVQAVGQPSTVPTPANTRRPEIRTPLVAAEWKAALDAAHISHRYPQIPRFITYGADAGIGSISTTFAPPNHPSIIAHQEVFHDIVNMEFQKGRYWGPFSRTELEDIIGPFQTSPLSLIPKPGKPGKFRLIQNLSYPRNVKDILSINSSIETDLYPCTWGTFATVATLVWSLPPGSTGACRDVAEAYRIVPLARDQWPGVVVRLNDDQDPRPFALNTCTCFGKKSSGGLFGMFADALLDILRGAGIGPSLRWVDDFVFFAIRREFLDEYNRLREKWRVKIAKNGGRQQKGGRYWFKGETLPSDRMEEFAEDMSTPLRDLAAQSGRTSDTRFTFSIEDVDNISAKLGIPWERSKDVPFGTTVPFIGFDWDLGKKKVSLQEKKREKYLGAIEEWRRRKTHTLGDVEKLYGKLLHTCLIIPEGRAYLTKLESMIGIFRDTPHKPRHPPRHIDFDLLWWLRTLSKPTLTREIPGAQEVVDVQAFSDASSTVGIGIVVRDRWRAWALKPGWNSEQRDIGWAEAVGMELLIKAVVREAPPGTRFKVYGDNRGVVEGWWTGRSRNAQVNEVFKRIHFCLSLHECTAYTRYVTSASNPADGPSRGIFPDRGKLLPPIELPKELEPFVLPLDHVHQQNPGGHTSRKPKISQSEANERHRIITSLDSQAWEQYEEKSTWECL